MLKIICYYAYNNPDNTYYSLKALHIFGAAMTPSVSSLFGLRPRIDSLSFFARLSYRNREQTWKSVLQSLQRSHLEQSGDRPVRLATGCETLGWMSLIVALTILFITVLKSMRPSNDVENTSLILSTSGQEGKLLFLLPKMSMVIMLFTVILDFIYILAYRHYLHAPASTQKK